MASFYRSTQASAGYIYDLGVKLSDYLFIESDGRCSAKFFAWLPEGDLDQEDEKESNATSEQETALFKSPFESRHPWIGNKRKSPATAIADPNSWIIYIPFDTCPFKLGGSLLAQANGLNGGQEPYIGDPDYFIDCYEVIRELTEDGIIKAGYTVGEGGLAVAADKMFTKAGLEIDITGIMSSYGETNSTTILFGEIPGVLIQINDNDFDYVDSQLLLQDIAYYPIGRPSTDFKGLKFAEKSRKGVADILASLLDQATEGED
jgi:phosphoribosylformylglycinamidine (FGAM) synthase-like enzyme